MVGDREVRVAERARRLDHLLQLVLAVRERRVRVEVALDVVLGDELRQLAVARRLDLAARLAKLRLDVGEAQPLVHLLLGAEALDLAGLDLGDPVLGDREAHLHGALAELDVVCRRAGEVLEEVAVRLRRDDPQVDRDPVLGRDLGSALPGVARRGGKRVLDQRGGERLRVLRGGDDVHVLARLGQAARRAGDRDTSCEAGCSRRSCASFSAMGRTSERRTRSAGPSAPSFSSCAAMFSSAFGPEALHRADAARSSIAWRRSSIEATPISS